MFRTATAAAGLATALTTASSSAVAAPPVDPHLGGVVFTGPTHAHPTAFHYNPAALALDPGTHLFLAGTLRLDQMNIERSSIGFDGQPGDGTNFEPLQPDLLTPGGFFAVYSDFNGERLTLGIAAYTAVAQRWLSGEPTLGYHTLGGHNYDLFITPAVAFRTSRIMVGFGFSVIAYSSLGFSFARDTALEAGTAGLQSDCGGAPCGAENPLAAERYDVDVSSTLNIAFNLGLVVRLPHSWLAGLAINSPPSAPGQLSVLSVESEGDVTVTGAPRDGGQEFRGRARVTYEAPLSVHLGARGPGLANYEWVLGLRWEQGQRQRDLDLRMFGGNLERGDVPAWYPRFRGMKSSFTLEAGLEQPERDRLRLGARVRLETAAVTDSRVSPTQIEGFNIGLAGGVEFRLQSDFAIAVGYALAWFPSITPDESAFDPGARLACVDQQFPLDECVAAAEGRAIPTAAGTYGRLRHSMSLGLRYDWF